MQTLGQKQNKIFGFLNGMLPDGRLIVTAATDEGETICSVVVMNALEGRIALGMNGRPHARHELYRLKYPSGFTLEWVPFALTTQHQGIKRLVKLHYERRKLTA